MKKYFGLSILTLFVVGLMCSSVFAAASLNGGNATVAAELIAPLVDYALPTGAANTGYQPNGAVAATSQVKFSLTGGKFSSTAGLKYNLCDHSSATKKKATGIAAAAPYSSVTLILTSPLASGTVYTLQSDDCAVPYAALAGSVLIVAGSAGGSTVALTADNALNPGDVNIYATTIIATVRNGLSAALLTAATDVIDFSATPTMTKFKTGLATSTAAIVITSDQTLGTPAIAVGTLPAANTSCATYPASIDNLTLTVTPGSGTTMGSGFIAATAYQAQAYKAGIAAGAVVVDGTIAAADANASGNLAMSTAIAVCGSSTAAALLPTAKINQILTVDSATALTARSYKIAVSTVAGATLKATGRSLLDAVTAWTWTLDATQYYLPLVKTTTGVETYIKLQAKNTTTGTPGVSLQVLATDGSMVTVTPSPASITAGTPFNVTGADIAALVTAAGKSVDGAKGFAVILTVGAPNADVFGYANIVNASGEKRVPLQRVNTAYTSSGVTIQQTIAE